MWLTAVFNTILDEEAAVAPADRRAKADQVTASIPKMPYSRARFDSALRVLALFPGDPQSIHLVLTNARVVGSGTSGGATPDSVRQWLLSMYERKSGSAADWKRGRRALLAMTGDIAGARKLAHELSAGGGTVDRIDAAILDRAAGDAKPYEVLMSACPDPDPAYVVAHGKPERRERYCEDVVAGFTGAIREELGARTPAPVEEMFIETNRIASVAFVPYPEAQTRMAVNERGDELSAALQKARDTIGDLSTAQRDKMADDLLNDW